jgi:hypothetical protein
MHPVALIAQQLVTGHLDTTPARPTRPNRSTRRKVRAQRAR